MLTLRSSGRLSLMALMVMVCCAVFAAPVTGYIFTTQYDGQTGTCSGDHIAYFQGLRPIGLLGGAPYPGGAAIPRGTYALFVTDAQNNLLGKSNGKVITIGANGLLPCTQLANVVYSTSSSFSAKGFDASPNGVYKVWLSSTTSFPPTAAQSITTMFKIPDPDSTGAGILNIEKFYDTNTNGVNDEPDAPVPAPLIANGRSPVNGATECELIGWKVNIQDKYGFSIDVFTEHDVALAPGCYVVTEYLPLEQSWKPTGNTVEYPTPDTVAPTSFNGPLPPTSDLVKSLVPTVAIVDICPYTETEVEFGNVCLDGGGAHYPCDWLGSALKCRLTTDANVGGMLRALNLRTDTGACFDPQTPEQFLTWLNCASNARNVAYILSSYLVSLKLDIYFGYVNPNALVYAPGTQYANTAGFVPLCKLLQEVDAELAAHGCVSPTSQYAPYQKYLRNILDMVARNKEFVCAKFCCEDPALRTSLGNNCPLPNKCDFSFLK